MLPGVASSPVWASPLDGEHRLGDSALSRPYGAALEQATVIIVKVLPTIRPTELDTWRAA